MNQGWIKLHRQLVDNPIVMKDGDHLALWVLLMLKATHSGYDVMWKGKRKKLKPGQLITGRKALSRELKISESKIERIIKLFKSEQQIEQQTSNVNRLISIVNWEKYQGGEQPNEQRVNNDRTTSEQRVDTYKNDKKDKNEEERREKDLISSPAFSLIYNQFLTIYPGAKSVPRHNLERYVLQGANYAADHNFNLIARIKDYLKVCKLKDRTVKDPCNFFIADETGIASYEIDWTIQLNELQRPKTVAPKRKMHQ